MADLAPIAAAALTPAAPIPDPADLLDRPRPVDDPFGPAVVLEPAAPQYPALVVYDAQGRLTTPVPPNSGVLPPHHIDLRDPDARPSLVYTS
jgi:hypothetical protein